MIDPIGVKPGTVQGPSVKSFESTPAVVPIESARPAPKVDAAQTSLPQIARQAAAQAPVDADRVHDIRKALELGRFPISPAKIADRLIAVHYRWAEKK